MLEEKAERKEERDIKSEEYKSMFFRPNDVSASVDKISPPTRQPVKNEEAGRPVRSWASGFKAHSEIMEEDDDMASVKTEIKVCWASKAQARETRKDWRNWKELNLERQCSTVEPREERWFSAVSAAAGDGGESSERRRGAEFESKDDIEMIN